MTIRRVLAAIVAFCGVYLLIFVPRTHDAIATGIGLLAAAVALIV